MAGCGGGGDADSPAPDTSKKSQTPAPLSKAKLIERSDEICDESWDEIMRYFGYYTQGWKASGKGEKTLFSRAVGDIFLPHILFWYDHINFLGPPEGDDGQVRRMLRALQLAVETGLDRPYSFDDPAEFAGLFTRSNRMVRRYGIRTCVVNEDSFAPLA